MSAKVYFASARGKIDKDLLAKTERLYEAAGFTKLFNPNEFVAVKVHFGEPGNTAFVRPQFARRIVAKIKETGAIPFLTDANTLYHGKRSNAVDHIEAAMHNGFSYATVGAPIIIADGLKGKDYIEIPVPGKHFDKVKIASAAYHADGMIVVSHVKGHEATGFAAALKNVGMGLGSRSGKQMMHSDMLPAIIAEKCKSCGKCMKWCPVSAISWRGDTPKLALIDSDKCIGCGECTVTCPERAIRINWKSEEGVLQEKIVEFALGLLQDKQGKVGYINFLLDITPDCDCCGWSDTPIVNDIGILASDDPVAIDKASIDLVNNSSDLREGAGKDSDKWRAGYDIDWSIQLIHAQNLGMGTQDYELIEVG